MGTITKIYAIMRMSTSMDPDVTPVVYENLRNGLILLSWAVRILVEKP